MLPVSPPRRAPAYAKQVTLAEVVQGLRLDAGVEDGFERVACARIPEEDGDSPHDRSLVL